MVQVVPGLSLLHLSIMHCVDIGKGIGEQISENVKRRRVDDNDSGKNVHVNEYAYQHVS